MKKSGFLGKKVPVVSLIAAVLVVVLGFGVFGMQYFSLEKEKNNLASSLEQEEKNNSELVAENAEKDKEINDLNSTLGELNSKVDDLNKTVGSLNSEVSRIKATKAASSKAASSLATSVVSSTSVGMGDDVLKLISLSNFTSANEGDKICYLTFDDGPSDNTSKILQTLKAANAKATFFVVGTSKMSVVSDIYSAGHTVALHTNTHLWSIYKDEQTYFSDLEAIKDKVKNITGAETNLIRFPGGSSNKTSISYNKGIMTRLTKSVTEKGYKYFDWNIDSGDALGKNVPAATIVTNIINESKGKDELCILMHDTGSKNTTVEALPYIICYLRSAGYRFEALTDQSNTFHHQRINN